MPHQHGSQHSQNRTQINYKLLKIQPSELSQAAQKPPQSNIYTMKLPSSPSPHTWRWWGLNSIRKHVIHPTLVTKFSPTPRQRLKSNPYSPPTKNYNTYKINPTS